MSYMRKYMCLPAIVLVICVLSGCAGLGLLSLVFRAVAVGSLIGEINDFFGHESTEFHLFIDGYDTGATPNPDHTLDLTGLPTGHHLLTVASTDRTLGFHTHVNIVANQSIDLGNITPIEGGTIGGRVRRQVGDSQVPMAGVLVAAVFGGGDVISAASGHQVTLPPNNDTDVVMMGFTDANGDYKLGPAQFGQWVVTTVYPAQFADALLTDVSAGDNPGHVDLLLKPDPSAAAPGSIEGTVVKDQGGAVADALVQLVLGTPLAPAVDPERVVDLESEIGPLMAQPWFLWNVVATRTNGSGAYNLAGPPGDHAVLGFKYGFQALSAPVTLDSGQVVNGDITLVER